jgi:tetratricopeptide (TPR) repeat protein
MTSDSLKEFSAEQIEDWRRAIRETTFSNYHLKMGMALVRSGEIPSAIESFRRSMNTWKIGFGSYVLLIDCLNELGDRASAEAVAQQAASLDPAFHANGLLALADDHADEGRIKDAEAVLDRLLDYTPGRLTQMAPIFGKLADLALRMGHSEEAVRFSSQALKHHPAPGPELWFLRGAAMRRLGRYAEAVGAMETVALFEPLRLDALVSSGYDRLIQLDFIGSAKILRRALAIDPGYLVTQATLCLCLLACGQPTAAYKTIEPSLPLPGTVAQVHSYAGLCLQAQGNVPAALAHYNAGYEKSRSTATYLGLGLQAAGDLTGAERLHRETLALETPKSSFALSNLALTLMAQGRSQEAKEIFTAAAAETPAMIPLELRLRPWAMAALHEGFTAVGHPLDGAARS